MAELILDHVSKVYPNGFEAVRDFSLEVENGEFLTVTGPSGCGKSTILRMIAGMEEITSGKIVIDGKVINHVAPEDRNLTMLFKNYALYPRMTVYDNIALGLRLRNVPETVIDEKVRETVGFLSLEKLLYRKVKTLTTWQRQRAAIGRVIVRKPGLILMEEPFADLDRDMRMRMWKETLRIHKELGTTIVYVTNDPAEALALGTKVIVMAEGEIQQQGTPQMLKERPNSLLIAGFIGNGFAT